MEEDARNTRLMSGLGGKRLARMAVSVTVTAVSVIGLLLGGLYSLLTLLFFDNFNLANFWHLFVMAYTLATPVLSVAGLLVYYWRGNRVTAVVALVLGLAPFCIMILWGAEGSRGLIH